MIDTQGRCVYQIVCEGTQLRIDRQRFRYPGVYVVRIQEADHVRNFKVLVE